MAEGAPEFLAQQPELGEHFGRLQALVGACQGVALRGGQDGRIVEWRARLDRARGRALHEPDQRIEEGRNVVGDGMIAAAAMEGLGECRIEPAGEDFVAPDDQRARHPGEVGSPCVALDALLDINGRLLFQHGLPE